MIEGIKPNQAKIKKDLEQSLMLVTALAPSIGYEKATEIAQLAHNKNISLRDSAIKLGYISSAEFDILTNPSKMSNPH